MGKSLIQPANIQAAPLPLVLSVVGHRDLRKEDLATLETRVREILRELRHRYLHTPLVLLSALADGADRLVTRMALDEKVSLSVLLPMPRHIYETEFGGPSSLEEFTQLMGRADACHELPLIDGAAEDQIRQPGPNRDRQYRKLGATLARDSHILIALWDGSPDELAGGVAEIIRFRLEEMPSEPSAPHNILDVVEGGPVYHIVTPRQSNPALSTKAFSLRKLFPEGEMTEQTRHRIYQRIDLFNKDALRLQTRQAALIQSRRSLVISDEAAQALTPAELGQRAHFALADALALHYQRWTFRTYYALLGLGLAAALNFQLYVSLSDKPAALAIAYLLLFFASFFLYLLIRTAQYEERYLDYRALAEGLRVQLFWRLAGLPDSAQEYYLRKQRGDLEWIRLAMRTWRPTHDNALPAQDGQMLLEPGRLELILKQWVQDQALYFERSSRRDQGRSTWINSVSTGFFILGVCLAVVKVFVSPENPLMIGIGFALIIATFLVVYGRTRAFSEHAKHYGRMRILFENARRRLQEKKVIAPGVDVRSVILELGKEALVENGDWVLIHRERPIEVPRT
jgi:protein-S-isoprenylcysteine O-methyltransferase Ste14